MLEIRNKNTVLQFKQKVGMIKLKFLKTKTITVRNSKEYRKIQEIMKGNFSECEFLKRT